MPNTQHTPGPWINDGDEISARVDPENSATYTAPICAMVPVWQSDIVAANARLIASAPTLLEALQAAVSTQPADSPIKWVLRARNAIRQATGQE